MDLNEGILLVTISLGCRCICSIFVRRVCSTCLSRVLHVYDNILWSYISCWSIMALFVMETKPWTWYRVLGLLISASFKAISSSMIGMSAATILRSDMVPSHHSASCTSTKHPWVRIFFLLPWTSTQHRILILLHLCLIIILRSRMSCSNRISHNLLLSRHLIVVTVSRRLCYNSWKQVSVSITLIFWFFKTLVIWNRSILLIVLLMLLISLLSRCSCSWLNRSCSNCRCIRYMRVIIWCRTTAILRK